MPLEALGDSSRQRPAGGFDEFSAYPPIADYAFLSDCEVTALVAPSGSVEWMCLPKMDGPSVFGAMLDRTPAGSGSARTT
jgi:GH15 family glucan-1,4-alpha-glucosidase